MEDRLVEFTMKTEVTLARDIEFYSNCNFGERIRGEQTMAGNSPPTST